MLAELVGGIPLREHLKAIWRKSGKKPEQLSNCLPDDLKYLWGWFAELHNTRGQGMNGTLPITYAEMESWSKMTGRELSTWEVAAIKLVDAVFCNPKRNEP